MPSRFYAEFPERAVDPSGKVSENAAGPDGKSLGQASGVPWPKPGPAPGVGFNRATKFPVVKTDAQKHGKD